MLMLWKRIFKSKPHLFLNLTKQFFCAYTQPRPKAKVKSKYKILKNNLTKITSGWKTPEQHRSSQYKGVTTNIAVLHLVTPFHIKEWHHYFSWFSPKVLTVRALTLAGQEPKDYFGTFLRKVSSERWKKGCEKRYRRGKWERERKKRK